MTKTPGSLSWNYLRLTYRQKKRGSLSCYSSHILRLSHCPVSRNEQRWKPHAVYVEPTSAQGIRDTKSQWGCTIHLIGAFPLLCSWQEVWSCEVLTRQNQSVKVRLICIYVSIPTFRPRGFQQVKDIAKVLFFLLKSAETIKKMQFKMKKTQKQRALMYKINIYHA